MKKKSFIILMLLPLLAACSSDAVEELTAGTLEARIASGTEPVDIMATFSDFTDANGGTTGTRSHATNNTFESGDQLWVGRGTNSSSNKAKLYKHNGTKFTSTDPLYWQQMTENLYGYWRGDDASGVMTKEFTCQKDQSTLQGLKNADFIYASNKDCTYPVSSNNAELTTFVHRMACIHVVVNDGNGLGLTASKLTNAYVGNANLKMKATVDESCNLTAKESNDTSTVKMYKNGSFSFIAMVIPQTVSNVPSFISVTYDGKTYRLLLNGSLAMEAGKTYLFDLLIKEGALVSPSGAKPLVQVTASDCGKLVSAMGYVYNTLAGLNSDGGGDAIGIIGNVSTAYNGSNMAHGEIVALADAGSRSWTDDGSDLPTNGSWSKITLFYNDTSTNAWRNLDIGGWQAIFSNFAGNTYSTGLNEKIEAAGGTGLSGNYWSTTHRYNTSYAAFCWSFHDSGLDGNSRQDRTYNVRACLAF